MRFDGAGVAQRKAKPSEPVTTRRRFLQSTTGLLLSSSALAEFLPSRLVGTNPQFLPGSVHW